jgi:hypothetical protein
MRGTNRGIGYCAGFASVRVRFGSIAEIGHSAVHERLVWMAPALQGLI